MKMMEEVKDCVNRKDYETAIEIVRKEIIIELTKLIQEQIRFKYTNIYDLIRCSQKYIKDNRKNVSKCLYFPEYLTMDKKDELVYLLESYKKLVTY